MTEEPVPPLGWVADALEEREASAARFQRESADREVDLERRAAERDEALAERKARLREAEELAANQREEVAWLRGVVEDRDRELAEIHASRTWRLTSWLRRR